jgi:hypothetical protein
LKSRRTKATVPRLFGFLFIDYGEPEHGVTIVGVFKGEKR